MIKQTTLKELEELLLELLADDSDSLTGWETGFIETLNRVPVIRWSIKQRRILKEIHARVIEGIQPDKPERKVLVERCRICERQRKLYGTDVCGTCGQELGYSEKSHDEVPF